MADIARSCVSGDGDDPDFSAGRDDRFAGRVCKKSLGQGAASRFRFLSPFWRGRGISAASRDCRVGGRARDRFQRFGEQILSNQGLLRFHRRDHRRNAHDVHDAGHIIGQHM
jgi:hypothetical protein